MTTQRTTKPKSASVKGKKTVPAASSNEQVFAGISAAAVKKATGKDWAWCAALDKAGAAKWTHAEIAAHLSEKCEVPPW